MVTSRITFSSMERVFKSALMSEVQKSMFSLKVSVIYWLPSSIFFTRRRVYVQLVSRMVTVMTMQRTGTIRKVSFLPMFLLMY